MSYDILPREKLQYFLNKLKTFFDRKKVFVTQAEYDALPDTKLTDGITYCITDATGDINAGEVIYDNTDSGLTAEDVQDALDELANNHYVLPKASTTTLGGVMVDGITIAVDEDGVISAESGGEGRPTRIESIWSDVSGITYGTMTLSKAYTNYDVFVFKYKYNVPGDGWSEREYLSNDVAVGDIITIDQYDARYITITVDSTTSFNISASNQLTMFEITGIKFGSGGSDDAVDITYDNTDSGLSADNVQDAIDELNSPSQAPSTAAYSDITDYWTNALKIGTNVKYTTSSNKQGFYDFGLQNVNANSHILMIKLSDTEGEILCKAQTNNSTKIYIRLMHLSIMSDWFEFRDVAKIIATKAEELPFEATSSLSSTNVQDAIEELESLKANKFTSFNLQGGSMTITNGFYLGIIQGNNVNYRTRMAFIRITDANTMLISYLTPAETTAEFEFTLTNYVLSTNGQNNGNVCVIKLD